MYLSSQIPMGEGQEEKALQSLEDAANLGQWLSLKNIHLVTSWLPILSQTLQNLDCHENFRYLVLYVDANNVCFI